MRRTAALAVGLVALAGYTSAGDHQPTSPPEASASSSLPSAMDPQAVARLRAALQRAQGLATNAGVTVVETNTDEPTSGSGRVDFSSDPLSFDFNLNQGQQNLRVISMAGTLYATRDDLGGRWATSTSRCPESPYGLLGGDLDPAVAFRQLESGLIGVAVESRRVGDEEFQVYVTTVATESLSDVPEGTDASLLPPTVSFEWSFDSGGYVRKLEADLGPDLAGFRETYANWGQTSPVSAPPPELVVTAPMTTATA